MTHIFPIVVVQVDSRCSVKTLKTVDRPIAVKGVLGQVMGPHGPLFSLFLFLHIICISNVKA